jgi:40S ribosome biogenesis protein Tsr1 and BMS1 C-terminal
LYAYSNFFFLVKLQESLPAEYARIFAFDNFSRTQKHVLRTMHALDEGSSTACAPVGSFVRIHVKNVPIDIASRVCHASKAVPVLTSALFQHESKMSVLHFRYVVTVWLVYRDLSFVFNFTSKLRVIWFTHHDSSKVQMTIPHHSIYKHTWLHLGDIPEICIPNLLQSSS